MKLYICVDDTDDLTKSTSTGKIADMIADAMVNMGGVLDQGVTRHQLLLHDDIDYTSHNSSMCMVIDTEDVDVNKVKEVAKKILNDNAADAADPGLCICRLDQLKDPDTLMAYGRKAQNEVISKQEAYDLAEEIGGTILEEYGGTGIGVIGALAGVGLRLSGCDGTFRGGKGKEYAGKTLSVGQLTDEMKLDQIIDMNGQKLSDDTLVTIDDSIKMAIFDNKKSLVVKEKGSKYIVCKKKDLYHNEKSIISWKTECENFEEDNDIEECYDDTNNACYNCLYRRWTSDGMKCVKKKDSFYYG